ncbi:MAG TPA: hypothetical protein VEB40_01935 [Flavipsychrobacter sp.]|nr:hypothetical protein [Flavipsychrobacter sp.]
MKNIFISILCALCLWGCSKDTNSKPSGSTNSTGSTGTSGQGGSLARYTIAQNHLYIAESQKLKVFSLANPADPQMVKEIVVGQDIETIYCYDDKLFMGSMNAMYIYSIANPSSPQFLGDASHVRACDPVVANDAVAYVTVRSGSACGGTTNALYVYDISNVLIPQQRKVIALTGPWGLGLKGDRLYVCDGGEGLMVYDISNAEYPSYIKKISGEIFYDVIAVNNENLLICMIEGGMAIYEVNGDNLTQLAKIVN